ncbi:hypothetical protein IGI37_000733 [Enterococcus sp. AZ194]|uniref:hypothetical protein n=1 Tax=Enterococcus sp. AZ194 TaxID=2774629 RepID=UPI003F1F00BD
MKHVIENVSKWTVGGITSFYQIFVVSTYFILSNLLGLVVLFFFQPTINNLVFFILPIFLMMQSIMMQFHILPQLDEYSIRRFCKEYLKILKAHFHMLLSATAAILLIILDVSILIHKDASSFFLLAVLITSAFLINGLLYIFLIEARAEAKRLPVSKKLISGLMLSYRLPYITFINMIYIGISLVSIRFMAVFYIIFIGGFLNLLIWKNLQKRFSLDLYFEQIFTQNKL